MNSPERPDDRITQDGWTVQPTQAAGEYRLSHDGIHVTFHGARLEDRDGIACVDLHNYSGGSTNRAAEVTLTDAPWRIEAWLRELVAETVGADR